MRLSKRERFLLAVLTLLLLWTGFYKFWIEPETDLLFANLQEINRLEEQIKRGGPQGKQNLEQTAEKLEQAGNGQIYFADMSPEKMDRKLLQLAGETGIQLSGVETGETKEMDTAGYVYTPLTLEFVCTDREQAAGFVEKINQEGAGMWIKSLQLEKDETAMKGTMEVVYCHDQCKTGRLFSFRGDRKHSHPLFCSRSLSFHDCCKRSPSYQGTFPDAKCIRTV